MDNSTNIKKRKRKKNFNYAGIIVGIVILLIILSGGIIAYGKYAPSKEEMPLSEYFKTTVDNEVAVIFDGQYETEKADPKVEAILGSESSVYLSLPFLKTNLDDGYVYDREEGILRYVTDTQVISAYLNKRQYSEGRDTKDFEKDVVLETNEGVFVNIDFVSQYTDITYVFEPNPNRIRLDLANREKSMATLSKNTQLRRFGGPKSKILKHAVKGENVEILEDYGKWSLVLSEDAVLGCVQNKRLNQPRKELVATRLLPREYTHLLMPEPVVLGWHQVGSPSGSLSTLDGVLSKASGINVISPTWYRLADNNGNIKDLSSMEYVNRCHARGIKVWGLVSNFEEEGVDTTLVLNRTSSRDNLVNSIVGAAIAGNLDGINIDFESLSIDAKDGYIQFIRELSLRCKNNDLVLSVDNYKPESFNMFYNRAEQAKYADYVIVMAYDEHHGASTEAGSNASLPFVKAAAIDTLAEVPKEQLVLALPFYTRVFITSSTGLSNQAIIMSEIPGYLQRHNAETSWLPEEEQYYATFESEGKTYQVWVENEESMSRKLAVYKENDLAGVAFWRLGAEPSSLWDIISGYIK